MIVLGAVLESHPSSTWVEPGLISKASNPGTKCAEVIATGIKTTASINKTKITIPNPVTFLS